MSGKWQCQSASRSERRPDVKKERTNGTNEKDASVSCSNWLTAFVHSENRATWANSNAAQQSRGGWMADRRRNICKTCRSTFETFSESRSVAIPFHLVLVVFSSSIEFRPS